MIRDNTDLQPGHGLVLTLMVTLLGSAPDHRALAALAAIPAIWGW